MTPALHPFLVAQMVKSPPTMQETRVQLSPYHGFQIKPLLEYVQMVLKTPVHFSRQGHTVISPPSLPPSPASFSASVSLERQTFP